MSVNLMDKLSSQAILLLIKDRFFCEVIYWLRIEINMIQNKEFCGNQTHLDVPMSSDHSRSNQLTYSQMAEQVDLEERDQHNSNTSLKVSGQAGDRRGNRSQNIQISRNEDLFQRTNNLNFRSFALDAMNISGDGNQILKEGIYKNQKELMPLDLKIFLKVVQKQSDDESKILLKPNVKEQKKLGQVLLTSRFEGGKAYDLSKVSQQSQIMQMQESSGDRSHFKAVLQDESGFDIFKKFQQVNAVQPEQHFEIKINGTNQKRETIKKSSFQKLLQHQSHISSQKYIGNQKQAFDSFTLNDKNRSSSQKKDGSSALLGSRISGSRNNNIKMVYSNIPIPKPEQKNQIEFKAEAIKVQQKKPLIQVSSRMMSTYNPNNRVSQYKNVQQSGKSEPDQHTNIKQSNKPLESNKFIDPLTASLTSNEKIKNQNNRIQKDLEEDLINRINNVQKLFRMLKDEDRQPIPSKDNPIHNNGLFQPSKFGNKVKSLQQMAPQDLFNGFSSIQSDDKFSKKSKANSNKISRQLQFITNKLISLQRAVGLISIRDKSMEQICEESERSQKFIGVPSFNSRTKLMNRQKPASKQNIQINLSLIQEELQQQLLSLDSNRMAFISSEQLAEIGAKIFQVFKIPIIRGKSMSVYQLKKCIRFYLSQQRIVANWDFFGILYIGKTSQPQYMVKQGLGTEIKPKFYVYKGYFKNNCKSGKGSIAFYNGNKYEGQWKDNQYNGYGLLEMSESRYKGFFKNGLKHGNGHEIFSTQDVYEGMYEQDQFHGQGRYVWFNGPTYQGEFQSGVIEGTGTWQSAHGDYYEGQFQKGLKHGFGRYTWKSGSVFEGQFVKGRMIRKNKRVLRPEKQLAEELSGQTQYVSPEKNTRFKSQSPIIRRFKVEQLNTQGHTNMNHRFF